MPPWQRRWNWEAKSFLLLTLYPFWFREGCPCPEAFPSTLSQSRITSPVMKLGEGRVLRPLKLVFFSPSKLCFPVHKCYGLVCIWGNSYLKEDVLVWVFSKSDPKTRNWGQMVYFSSGPRRPREGVGMWDRDRRNLQSAFRCGYSVGAQGPILSGRLWESSHSKGSWGIYPPSAAHECGVGSGGMN